MQRLREMRWTQRALPDAQKARCCQSEIQVGHVLWLPAAAHAGDSDR